MAESRAGRGQQERAHGEFWRVLGWPSPPLEDYSPGELYQRGCSSRPWEPASRLPFPSGNHLLPMVVVSTHCPASSEAAHHGVRPSTVSWDLSLGFQGALGAL